MRIHKFAGLLCAFAFTAAAAPVTFTFTGSGGTVGGPSPYGDTRTYTNGAYTVTATAFSLPANETGNFVPGQLNWYNTLGLAVCNHTGEGANCDNPEHQVDNNGSYDFVLFTFNTVVDPASIVINPYDTWDRDVTYWIGNTGTNLSTVGLAGLAGAGFGGRIDDDSTSSSAARTVLLGGGNGNALLFGARLGGNNDDDYIDRFKIESLTINTAPEPATFGLAGMALIGLGLLRRRVKAS